MDVPIPTNFMTHSHHHHCCATYELDPDNTNSLNYYYYHFICGRQIDENKLLYGNNINAEQLETEKKVK